MATRAQYRAPTAFSFVLAERNKKKGTPRSTLYVAGVLMPRELKKLGAANLAALVADGRVIEEQVRAHEPAEVAAEQPPTVRRAGRRGGKKRTKKSGRKKSASPAKSDLPAATS